MSYIFQWFDSFEPSFILYVKHATFNIAYDGVAVKSFRSKTFGVPHTKYNIRVTGEDLNDLWIMLLKEDFPGLNMLVSIYELRKV